MFCTRLGTEGWAEREGDSERRCRVLSGSPEEWPGNKQCMKKKIYICLIRPSLNRNSYSKQIFHPFRCWLLCSLGQTHRWTFPWYALHMVSLERFLLPSVLWCLLFFVTNKIMYLLTGWNAISNNIHHHAAQDSMGLSSRFLYNGLMLTGFSSLKYKA